MSADPDNQNKNPPQESGSATGGPSRRDDFSDVKNRLDALEGKLKERRPEPSKTGDEPPKGGHALAFRVSSDFIAAIFVGGVLGWGIDHFAGTTPWGLVILLLLGFAAGVLNVMRTLGMVAPAPSQQARPNQRTRHRDTGKGDPEGR